jgi:hypothetical protein
MLETVLVIELQCVCYCRSWRIHFANDDTIPSTGGNVTANDNFNGWLVTSSPTRMLRHQRTLSIDADRTLQQLAC